MNSNKIPYKLDVPIDPEMGGSLMECLMVIFKFHNMTFSRESLLAGLPIVSGQLSPKGFEKAAGRAGMKSKTAQRSIKNINTSLLPAVLLLDNSQSCVITSIDVEQGTAQIIYPELTDGYEDIKIEDLESKYTGYVIFARPNIKYESEKARKFSKTNQHWFWGTIKESKSLYKDVIIASLFISLLSVALPLFVMNIYDRVVPNSSISTLWVLATGVLIALFADFFLRALRHFFVELAASRIDVTLSSTLMEKVLGLSMKEKPKSSGSFINNFQSFESVRAFLNSVTLVALVDLPFAMIFIGIILMIDWHLAMPIFAGAIIILIYGAFTQKTIRNLAEESMAISSRKHGLLTESIIALEDVKVFGKESKVQYEWERQTIFLAKVNAKTRLVGTSVNNVSLWIQQTVSVIIIIVGVYMIIDGQITQGSLIAAYLLSSRAMSPISQTAGLIAQFYHASTALDSLNDLMKKESETSRNDQKSSAHKFQGNIEFQQVSFQYDDDSKLILNNMNLSIKAGEHVAILGKNGCGKSTLNKLLLSLYHPTGGLATLDHVDINQYEPSFLRSRIGYVPQDVVLFSGSLRENIWPHGAQINEDRVRKVIEKCGLVSLVNSHPDGINQFIGEKGNLLSGGQRQAVAIARAVMMEPRIFILDEPTSAMDANNEILLKKMLKQEIAGKTLILNTHRASLLDLVDRVVVLEKGGITSSGPKADILKQKATLANNLPGVKK